MKNTVILLLFFIGSLPAISQKTEKNDFEKENFSMGHLAK